MLHPHGMRVPGVGSPREGQATAGLLGLCEEPWRFRRRRPRTSNGIERVNQEFKRRTRVASHLPNEAPILSLVSTLLAEIRGQWKFGKIYRSMHAEDPAQA